MRNIFIGFSEVQRTESTSIILENLWTGARTLAKWINKEGLIKNDPNLLTILEQPEGDWSLSEISAKAISEFWKLPQIQELVKKKPENLQLQECFLQFVEELKDYPKWGGPKWIPSADDCIRARVRSSGVAEEHFTIDGTTFKIFDAGGQRSKFI